MKVRKALLGSLLVLAPLLSLGGCVGSDIATCAEYAKMADDTGLMSSPNSDQVKALKAALDEAGFADSESNRMLASTRVIAYCNIYGGVASSNQEQPITAALPAQE